MPDWLGGVQYTLGLLSILLAHEFGHYFAARRFQIEVTLPYFIPGLPPLYTFGAFIRMRARRMSRRSLLTVGAAGPLAGAIVAFPVYFIGMALSEKTQLPQVVPPDSLLFFGDSLITWATARLFFGELSPGTDIVLHPLAYAGWVGLFVTALNLIPIGQLDGGHIGYAVFGEVYRKVAWLLYLALVLCGAIVHPAWLVLSIFLAVTGVAHPPIIDHRPISTSSRIVGGISLLLFVLTFVPQPVVLPSLFELLANR